jgi:hypothetical protein
VLASIAFVLASPVVTHRVLLASHAASHTGICGPHAPDIAAYPCTREVYMAEFGAGFAGVGLLLLEAAAMVGAAAIVGAGWMIARFTRRGAVEPRA